jgi:hypothetical protein
MSILERLKEESVFGINLTNDKTTLEIYEACDFHYEESLTKKELGLLIEELTEIYKEMKDEL